MINNFTVISYNRKSRGRGQKNEFEDADRDEGREYKFPVTYSRSSMFDIVGTGSEWYSGWRRGRDVSWHLVHFMDILESERTIRVWLVISFFVFTNTGFFLVTLKILRKEY